MAGDTKAFTIAAGGSHPINGNGQTYLFCQFADRPINVRIGGETVTMRAGSYQEFEPLSGTNARVTFENTDPDAPAAVVFVMGKGTYDEKIIRGEVSVEPILRNADGTTKPDTRHTVAIDLLPVSAETETLEAGTLLASAASPEKSGGAVFVRPDGIIAQSLLNTGPTYRGVAEYDQDLNLIQVLDMNPMISMDTESLGWTPETGYITFSGSSIKEFATGNTLFSVGFTMKSFCIGKGGTIVAVSGTGELAQFDAATFDEILRTTISVAVPSSSSQQTIAYDRFNDRYILHTYNDAGWRIYDADFEQIGTFSDADGYPSIAEGFDVERNTIYRARTQQVTGTNLFKNVLFEFTPSPKLRAVRPGCGVVGALLKREATPQLTASITATEVAQGIQVEGELIKAALEYHYRRAMPDDYLDHVYAFDVSRDKDGLPVPVRTSGNRTFARASVSDDFSTLTPSRVVLTIDDELQQGATL